LDILRSLTLIILASHAGRQAQKCFGAVSTC